MTLLVLIGSLLAVAVWEFCRARRRLEFPASRRRLGNLGIWVLNVALAAFIFAPPDTFRPQLEAALGVDLPSWPIADRWLSFAAAFLLLDFLNFGVLTAMHGVVQKIEQQESRHKARPSIGNRPSGQGQAKSCLELLPEGVRWREGECGEDDIEEPNTDIAEPPPQRRKLPPPSRTAEFP